MFLCPSCEASRFPPTTRPATEGVKTTAAVKTTQVSVNKAKDAPLTAVAIGASTPSGVTKSPSEHCHYCSNCEELIDAKSIHCDICDNSFHQECSGMPSDIFETLLLIVNETGWACQSCRRSQHDRLSSLQTALTRVTEELSDIRSLLNQFSMDHNNIKKSVTTLENAWSASAISTTAETTAAVDQHSTTINSNNINQQQMRTSPDITLEVYRALSDKARRKQNIIVTGLPETIEDDISDEMKFIHLCEEHLSIKPALKYNGCRRLGKPQQGASQPRRLLVSLNTEQSAHDLLVAAKELRLSDDAYIARSVFINPDLSPTEAKLAYEQRQRRRAAKMRQTSATAAPTPELLVNSDNPSGTGSVTNETVPAQCL